MSPRLTRAAGDTRVAVVGGAVAVEHRGDALLIDAPPGVCAAVAPSLPRLRAIACTSGRIGSVGGLVPLLCALERHRAQDAALALHVPLGEERAATLAEVWQRCWPDRYPLVIDAQRPGAAFDVGAIEVETHPIRTGSVHWATGEVEREVGMALCVRTPDLSVAVILGAAPDRGLARVCAGANLAVIEVGVADWPRTPIAWRLRPDEAAEIGAGAGELWLTADDGSVLGPTS